jgi:drug/metabolite transporter (DMT)-like permease
LGEKVRLRRWLAVLVGLIGVLVVLRPGQTELTAGHLAALAAAVGGSLASIVVRKIGTEERPVVMLLYPMVVNFALMACVLPFVYKPMPIEHLGMLAIIATFAWIASRLVIAAYQNGEAAIIAPMQYSQIVWATGFGLLFFDETIDQATGIGAGIIIASGLYIVLRESRSGNSENTPVLRTRSRSETGTTPRVSLFMRFAGKTPPRQD